VVRQKFNPQMTQIGELYKGNKACAKPFATNDVLLNIALGRLEIRIVTKSVARKTPVRPGRYQLVPYSKLRGTIRMGNGVRSSQIYSKLSRLGLCYISCNAPTSLFGVEQLGIFRLSLALYAIRDRMFTSESESKSL
jgi:hypothetical protein